MKTNVPADSSMCLGLTVEQLLIKSTWDMVHRISRKYKANTVSHLKSNTNAITDVKEIYNTLAEQFAFNSSSDNDSHRFNRYRLKLEKNTIDFDTKDHYSYYDVFTLHELKQTIKVSFDTSPGIDTVHYQLLKHLLDDRLLLLLYIFNHIWLTQDFPTSWKTAIIIPVPKPGKVLLDPGSYRPIALTSCLCKQWSGWSTVDNLVPRASQSYYRISEWIPKTHIYC